MAVTLMLEMHLGYCANFEICKIHNLIFLIVGMFQQDIHVYISKLYLAFLCTKCKSAKLSQWQQQYALV